MALAINGQRAARAGLALCVSLVGSPGNTGHNAVAGLPHECQIIRTRIPLFVLVAAIAAIAAVAALSAQRLQILHLWSEHPVRISCGSRMYIYAESGSRLRQILRSSGHVNDADVCFEGLFW